MINVPDHLASIRYLANEMISQLDTVHKMCSNGTLDVETVTLNLTDLTEQMNVISAELFDMKEALVNELESENASPQEREDSTD